MLIILKPDKIFINYNWFTIIQNVKIYFEKFHILNPS